MKNRNNLNKLTQLALIIALEVIMAYTPLGYVHLAGLEISFLSVPVCIGAIIISKEAGALLGLIFGLTSFFQCFGSSVFGATLLSISVIKTFITCVVTRVLEGYLTGVIFNFMKKNDSLNKYSFYVASLATPVLNTLFFMSALVIFFYNSEFIQGFVNMLNATNPLSFVIGFVGIQGVVEAIVCFMICSILTKVLSKVIAQLDNKKCLGFIFLSIYFLD